MPPTPSDRTLRRLVTDLAAVHPDDVEAILEDLEDGARTRVRALLRDYLGAGPQETRRPAAPAAPPPVAAPETELGLSPWLAQRVGADLAGGPAAESGARAFRITAAARAALRAAAATLPRIPVLVARPRASVSLGARLRGLFAGGRA